MRRISKLLFRHLLPLLLLGAVLACSRHLAESTGLLELGEGEIRFPATVSAEGFATGMSGYHLVVWKQGRAAHPALFRADVTDTETLDGLELLGARPGNALGLDTWEERDNEDSDASDQVIQGPLVEILVEIPGRDEPLTLSDIFEDPGGRGFEMRFGGHRDNIPKWRSGCVACLYSCPGSKVGNARYTVRDYVQGATDFGVREGVLPADGTQVTIIIRLVKDPAAEDD
jgi:hypothetical protein